MPRPLIQYIIITRALHQHVFTANVADSSRVSKNRL